MHLCNRCSLHNRINLWNTLDNKKIYAHNYWRTSVYFERFSAVLGRFPKWSCAKHLLFTKVNFLKKWASTLALGIFSISETYKIKDNRVSIRYISVRFDRKFNRKKVIIHFFSGTKRRERETYQRHFMVALKVASNCQLFYLPLSLKISKEG